MLLTIDMPGGIFNPAADHTFTRPMAATSHVQAKPIPDSTAPAMVQLDPSVSLSATPRRRAAAFSVHVFTALGAGLALLALLEAVREHWVAMFAWLGVALAIDAADGPMARRLDVVRLRPNWPGACCRSSRRRCSASASPSAARSTLPIAA